MRNMVVEKIVGNKVTFTPRYYKKLCGEAKKRGTSPQKLFNKIVGEHLKKVNRETSKTRSLHRIMNSSR